MRRWIGYPPLVVLLLVSSPTEAADKGKVIDPCPKDNVCVNFVEDSCRVEGEMTTKDKHIGVVWNSDTQCVKKTYETVFARLEIELTTLQKWSFVVTTHFDIETIQFFFSKATVKFPSNKMADFIWNSGGKEHKVTLVMETLPEVKTGSEWKLKRYSFVISADGEKLIDFFRGYGVKYQSKARPITLTDPLFAQLLEEQSKDNSMAVAIGCGIAGALLVVILCCVSFFMWRRRRGSGKSETSKKSAYLYETASETARATKKEKKKSRNPLKKFFHRDDPTDIEGLHTERFSNDKSTNRVVSVDCQGNAAAAEGAAAAAAAAAKGGKGRSGFRAPPPLSPHRLQEPKGAAAAAGPPLPKGFQSVALA